MDTIYNPYFSNIIQHKIINDTLDKLLKNNDILITNKILEFLSGNCDHCNSIIVNPRIIDGNIHVCEKCINHYIYCVKDECRKISHYKNIKYNDRCKKCLSWQCNRHKKEKCCQTRIERLVDKIKKKLKS